MRPDKEAPELDQEQESEYLQFIREQYDPGGEMRPVDEAALLFLLNAPENWGIESQVMEYAKAHPEMTVRELADYSFDNAPSWAVDDGSDEDEDDDYDYDEDPYPIRRKPRK